MKIKFYVGIMLFILGFKVNAELLSWEDIVTKTHAENPEIKAAINTLRSLEFQEEGTMSGYYPTVTASLGRNFNLRESWQSNSFLGLSATENLFSGFSDTFKIKMAGSSRGVAKENLKSVKSHISAVLKTTFMEAIYSKKYFKLMEEIIKRREANLKLVQLRFESGRENLGTIELSKAYLLDSKYEYFLSENALKLNFLKLGQLIGKNESRNFDFDLNEKKIPFSLSKRVLNDPIDLESLMGLSPEFKKSVFSNQKSMYQSNLNKSAFYPKLNLSQNWENPNWGSSGSKNNWALGLTLTIPLFDGGKDYYALKSSIEEYRATSEQMRSASDATLLKLQEALSHLKESAMKLEVDNAFLLAAKMRQKIAMAQYNNGLISFTEWDIIENELIARQKAVLISEKERVNAEALWEEAQGKGVFHED